MRVDSLALAGFRNYVSASADFLPGVNVITGRNAQGKTNLLEAVYYLTGGRALRARGDAELISFNAQEARILANITAHGRETVLEAKLLRGRRRELRANGVRLKTAAELVGKLAAVLFCPDDLEMISAGAQVRRGLLDSCITQLRPRYAQALARFTRLYEHKTRILRDWRGKPSLLDTLDDHSAALAEVGALLIYYRAAFARKLGEKAAEVHREFSGLREELTVRYKTVSTIPEPLGKTPRELLPLLQEHQAGLRQTELDCGRCLSGAHKDDLIIEINGAAARLFASRGQMRTAALSVKLAEREIIFDDTGEYPVLLLDDVLSELDTDRQSFVLNRISSGQVLITCCEDEGITRRTGGRVLVIDRGNIHVSASGG